MTDNDDARSERLNQIIADYLAAEKSGNAPDRGQLLEQHRSHEKKITQLQTKLANSQGSDLASQAIDINGVKVLAAQLENKTGINQEDDSDALVFLASCIAFINTSQLSHCFNSFAHAVLARSQQGKDLSIYAEQLSLVSGGHSLISQHGVSSSKSLIPGILMPLSCIKSRKH